MSRAKSLTVCEAMCATCPFREGSPYAYLRESLTLGALNKASRICHSTGSNNAINARTGRPAAICRGARDVQLRAMVAYGILSEPTDAAWDAKARALGMTPNQRR